MAPRRAANNQSQQRHTFSFKPVLTESYQPQGSGEVPTSVPPLPSGVVPPQAAPPAPPSPPPSANNNQGGGNGQQQGS